MPKLYVEFALPEDSQAVEDYLKIADYKLALNEIYRLARNQIKHGEESGNYDVLEQIKNLAYIENDF